MGGAAHEVAATLNALEGKLRELERELLSGSADAPVPDPPSPRPPPPPPPRAPAAPPPAPDPLAELVAFRDLLARSADTLIAEYERLLDRLRNAPPATAAAPPPEPTYRGHVAVEVAPFPDVATLLAFERAALTVPGVREGRVSSYDGRAATLHLLVADPVPLASELQRVSPVAFTVAGGHPGALVLELSSGA
jgi:hypothetical protein